MRIFLEPSVHELLFSWVGRVQEIKARPGVLLKIGTLIRDDLV